MYFFITNKFIDFSGCKDIHSSNGAIYLDEGILGIPMSILQNK